MIRIPIRTSLDLRLHYNRNQSPILLGFILTCICPIAFAGCAGTSGETTTFVNRSTPEIITQRLRVGMTQDEVEKQIATVRLGDELYWRDGNWGTASMSYTIGDGVFLWVTYDRSAWENTPTGGVARRANENKLISVQIGHISDLKPKISPELLKAIPFINGTPVGPGLSYNPLALIRCVNYLHGLGKERALMVLREYARLTELAIGESDRPDNFEELIKFDLQGQRIHLIARLLFQRADGNPQMPAMDWMALGFSHDDDRMKDNQFPLYPLAVECDIPFDLSAGAIIGGDFPAPREILDYCAANCVMRKDLLSPSASPRDAAAALFDSPIWKQLFKNRPPEDSEGTKQIVRIEALRCLENLLNGEDFLANRASNSNLDENAWTKYMNDSRLHNIRWDPAKQTFVKG